MNRWFIIITLFPLSHIIQSISVVAGLSLAVTLTLFLMVFVLFTIIFVTMLYIIISRLMNIHASALHYKKSRFAKFFFELKIRDVVSTVIVPIAIGSVSILINFGVFACMLVSSVALFILLIITSQFFLNFLFNLEELCIKVMEILQEFFSVGVHNKLFSRTNKAVKVSQSKEPCWHTPSFLSGLNFSTSRLYSTDTLSAVIRPTKNFTNFNYTGSVVMISELVINELVDQFFLEIMSRVGNSVVMLQIQAESQGRFYSFCKLQTVNIHSQEQLKVVLKLNLNYQYSKYHDYPIDSLFIRWRLLNDTDPLAIVKLQSMPVNVERISLLTTYNLPKTMNLKTWEVELTKSGYELIHAGKNIQLFYNPLDKSKIFISIQKKGKNHRVKFMISTETVFTFTDTLLKKSKKHESFTRQLDNGNVVTYENGEQLILVTKNNSVAYLKRLPTDKSVSSNFITLDLETRVLATGNLEPISAVFFDGSQYSTYFLYDFTSSRDMLEHMITDLFKLARKDASTIIYVHNFSGFDSIFLLGILADYASTFNILKRDGNIISLIVSKKWDNDDKTTLVFKDSQLLLPVALKDLAEAFAVTNKGSYDHNTSNTPEDLNVIKDELLLYNKQDCLVLYEVISKFQDLIYELFSLDVHKSSTLSSLAFKTYLSNFMPADAQIPITDLKLYDLIRPGYTGGHVDVYVPESHFSKKVYCYDVNALYPSVMANNDYPIGNPTFFEGSKIDLNDAKTFGFLRVRVTCPTDMHIPFLQVSRQGKTFAAVGSWTDWYFSEELKYAITLGYKFEVLQGVLFERGPNLFTKYVQTLYTLRQNYPTADPRNLICKLLLNSLYGRFGMNPRVESYKLVDRSKVFSKLHSDEIILSESKMLIANELIKNQDVTNLKGNYLQISLPIAMATTAYARMNMYTYKKLLDQDLLYTDTDSVMCTKPLAAHFVGSGLGMMKLEYVATRAVFLAPKVYAIELADGYKEHKDAVDGVIYKIKGAKKGHGLNYKIFMELLYKNTVHKIENQQREFKIFKDNTINLQVIAYTLKVTENKRELIYENNRAVSTRPIIIMDDPSFSASTFSTPTGDSLKIITYEPARFAISKYTHFMYNDINIRYIIRF